MDKPLSQEQLKGAVVTPTDIAIDHLNNSVSIAEMLGNKTAIAQTDQLKVVLSEVKRLQAIKAERDRYKAELAFYAEPQNWELPSLGRGHSPVVSDRGERARKVLKGADNNETSR